MPPSAPATARPSPSSSRLWLILACPALTKYSKADGVRIQAQRIVNADTGEIELYYHSTQRQKKEEGMHRQVGERLEAELQKLADGLHKKRTTKHDDKVLERIGRLRQKYSLPAQQLSRLG